MEEIRHVVQPWEEGWRLGRVIRSGMQVSASQLKSARWNGRLFLDGAPARADDRVHAGQDGFPAPCGGTALVPSRPLGHCPEHSLCGRLPAGGGQACAHGLPVQRPAARQHPRKCPVRLGRQSADYVYRPVNRLDKGTSGLMVVARSAHVQQLLQRQLHTPQMVREYLAVTQGEPPAEEGLIDLPIAKAEGATVRRCVSPAGKPAVTHYRVLRRGSGPGAGTSAAGDRAYPSNSRASGRPGMPGGGRFPLRGGVDRLAGTLRAALPPATFASPPNR